MAQGEDIEILRVAGGSCLEPDGSSGRTLMYIRLSVERTCSQYKLASSLAKFIGSGNHPQQLSGLNYNTPYKIFRQTD